MDALCKFSVQNRVENGDIRIDETANNQSEPRQAYNIKLTNQQISKIQPEKKKKKTKLKKTPNKQITYTKKQLMTLRNIISSLVYRDFVSENLLPIEFSCHLGGQSPVNLFFPINRRPGLYKRLKTTKTKQAGNTHNPI